MGGEDGAGENEPLRWKKEGSKRAEWNLFSSRFMYCLTGIGRTSERADDLCAVRLTVCLLLIQRSKNKRFVVRLSDTAFSSGRGLLGE